MLNKIKEFFQSELTDPDQTGTLADDKRRLACAALLIEVAIVDHKFDQTELAALHTVLQEHFGISATECSQLTELAQTESEESTSLYQFTQLVNQYCSATDKFELVKGMWLIAYADGNLDKYEEYIIRKVADLIYLSHSDFIRAKHTARPE